MPHFVIVIVAGDVPFDQLVVKSIKKKTNICKSDVRLKTQSEIRRLKKKNIRKKEIMERQRMLLEKATI